MRQSLVPLLLFILIGLPAAAQSTSVLDQSLGLLQKGKYSEARALIEHELSSNRSLTDQARASLLFCLASALQQLEDYPASIESWHQVLMLSPAEKAAWGNLGWVYYRAGELDSAVLATEQSLVLDSTQAWAWGKMGLYMLVQGDLERMRDSYARAAKHVTERKVWDGIRSDVETYCEGADRPGCSEAWETLESSWKSAWLNTLKRWYEQSDSLQALTLIRKYPDGYRDLFRSLDLVRKSEAMDSTARLRTFGLQLDIARAFEIALVDSSMRKQMEEQLLIELNTRVVGLTSMGLYPQAIKEGRRALDYARTFLGSDNLHYATALNNLAESYRYMKRYNEAEPLHIEAKELRLKLLGRYHKDYIQSHENLALLYLDAGRYIEAESLLIEVKELRLRLLGHDSQDYATSLNNLATLYHLLGRYTDAESLYVEAKRIHLKQQGRNNQAYATALNNLAVLYTAMSRYSDAEPLYVEAKATYMSFFGGNHPDYANLLNSLGSLYIWMGRYTDGEPLLSKAGDILERNVDSNFTVLGEKERDQYYATLELTLEMQICIYALHMRDSETAQSTLLDRRLAMKGRLFSASLLQRQMQRAATKTDPQRRQGKVRWQDVRAALAPREAAVELIRFRLFTKNWTDTVYYAALITTRETTDHPRLVLLTNGNQLEVEGTKLYRAATRKGARDLDRYECYQMFWQAIDSALGDVRTVYLSPDGVYNQINPEVFLDAESMPLQEKYDIRILQSTRDLVLSAKRERSPAPRTAVLVGNPDFDLDAGRRELIAKRHAGGQSLANVLPDELSRGGGDSWNPLSGTETETAGISKELSSRGWTLTTLTGAEAVKEAVLTVRRPGVLHLATHGEFLADRKLETNYWAGRMSMAEANWIASDPLLRARIILAGANSAAKTEEGRREGRGFISAKDVLGMDLEGTELVVLSACETGLGVQRSGEGVYGLQRAFLLAGARNVLMSLWEVNDASTALLMERFYVHWLGGQSPHAALKQAKEDVRLKYPDPYYWAAFVLVEG